MKTRIVSVFLLFFISLHGLLAQNTPWDIIYCLNGGENKSVGISKLPVPNPVSKPGWNLVFSDEFQSDSLNAAKWNRSTFLDDQPAECNRGFAVNPGNILVESGNARISNTVGSLLPGCPYSFGEIKTMSVKDTSFRSYYFYAPGYLETRVKLYNKTGQGAACWLWGIGTPENPGTPGPWNEIDVFELNGVNSNIFNGAYHWTYNGKHVSQHHAIYLTDSAQMYDLSANWTTFGLEWDSTAIRWYVNNLLVKELDLTRVPPFCLQAANYSQPVAPFCLRLNSGNNSVGNQSGSPDPVDFPQLMLVDYVRMYKKTGMKASPIVLSDGIPQICAAETSPSLSSKFISAHYYPGAVYTWSSPAFEFLDVKLPIPQPRGKKIIWIKPSIASGQSYPVYLDTQFPGNYAERDSVMIYIAPEPPTLPAGNFTSSQVDTVCRFAIQTPALDNIAGCDFSVDAGITWNAGTLQPEAGVTTYAYGTFKPGQLVSFMFRVRNGCGYSPSGSYSITMPEPPVGCKWPAGTDETAQNGGGNAPVSVMPNPFTTNLNLKFGPSQVPSGREINIRIYDVYSREMVNQATRSNNCNLDLHQLCGGVYFLIITDQNTVIFRTAIVKR